MIQRQRTAESLRRSVWPPLPRILREQRRGNSLVLSGAEWERTWLKRERERKQGIRLPEES